MCRCLQSESNAVAVLEFVNIVSMMCEAVSSSVVNEHRLACKAVSNPMIQNPSILATMISRSFR